MVKLREKYQQIDFEEDERKCRDNTVRDKIDKNCMEEGGIAIAAVIGSSEAEYCRLVDC